MYTNDSLIEQSSKLTSSVLADIGRFSAITQESLFTDVSSVVAKWHAQLPESLYAFSCSISHVSDQEADECAVEDHVHDPFLPSHCRVGLSASRLFHRSTRPRNIPAEICHPQTPAGLKPAPTQTQAVPLASLQNTSAIIINNNSGGSGTSSLHCHASN